jgi:DNA-binding response OmpR family regulator
MKKILLIEDNEDICNNTAEILELSNYTVITAENGKTGVEKAILEQPDLIICDIMMPLLDGYGVLHAVHKNEKIKNTPFIFLTAKTERGDFRKGMEMGADDYITKPFSGTELLNAVDGRLKKHDLLLQGLVPDPGNVAHPVNSSFSNDAALKNFTEGRNTNSYKKKQTIYSVGNYPNRLYYILHGKVKVFKTNEEGKELVVDLYTSGDFFGYVALLEGTVYHDTAQALEESEIAVIPKEDFEDLLHNNTNLSEKFIRILARNVSEKESQLIGLAYNSLRKKVAEALLLIQKKYPVNDPEKFSIDINRDNLATIAGTATESLIRTLTDFKAEKIIDVQSTGIVILNQKKLEHLVN